MFNRLFRTLTKKHYAVKEASNVPKPFIQSASAAPTSLALDFPASIQREFPDCFDSAWEAVQAVLGGLGTVQFAALEKHSPALRGFDWRSYLRLSVIRMLHAQRALAQFAPRARTVLDYGAYFGNFSLMLQHNGFQVDAVDDYVAYADSLGPLLRILHSSGIHTLTFGQVGPDLSRIASSKYDAVLCMGVIEHIPHTPRFVLDAIDRVLKPEGILLIDTPNLAYVYTRQKLERGETIHCPISVQYFTEIPFQGHHREYTIAEVEWMLNQMQHDILTLYGFNMSIYGLSSLEGKDLHNYHRMQQEEQSRELIFSASRKRIS